MNAVTPDSKATPRAPWGPIVARVTAALAGGYALTYAAGLALAKFLPLRPSEAVYLISILQITLYVGVVIWVFSVPARRAWLTLAVLTGLCFALAHFK